jgi:hypothetical protein
MRYFFHVRDGFSEADLTGTEFPSFQAAHGEAVSFCGAMLRDLDGELPLDSEWRMDVTDETGATVLTLRFIRPFRLLSHPLAS